MFALETFTLEVKTTAGTDILDLTPAVAAQVKQTGVAEGLLTLFISGSTAALSTIEFESGVINDLRAAIERLFPQDIPYEHDRRWGDGNGYAHVRAAFLKPSLGIPLAGGRLQLGTWQQIVLLDFDNRPRQRHIQGQVMGLKSGSGSRQPG
jgi:secondary thiamine-phosphate synthase enzyme